MRQKRTEFLLVHGFVVCLFGRDAFHADVFHDGVIQRLIAEFLADLDHAWNLVSLAFAHQVGDGRSEDEDFQGGDAAFFVYALEKILRDDPFEGLGKGGPDFILLLGRKDVNDTVHGFSGAGGVEGAEHQVAGAGSDQRQFDGLEIAQLTDQNNIGILAQGAAKRGGEGFGVDADLAVIDQAILALVHELDWVFHRDNMVAPVLVGVVRHSGQRRGFAGAGGPRDNDEATVKHGKLFQHRRQRGVKLLKVLKRQNLAGDLPEDSADAVFLIEEIGAEARDVGNFVTEIHVAGFLEMLDLVLGGDFVEHLFELVVVQRLMVHDELKKMSYEIAPEYKKIG